MPRQDAIVGPVPDGRDPVEYDRLRRRVLWSMPTGLFVVGSRSGGDRNLMTCNWVMQVATSPKLVAVAVEIGSVTGRLIGEAGCFSVSVVRRTERSVVRRFVKPVERIEVGDDGMVSSMQDEPVIEVARGLPVLGSSSSWLACEVRQALVHESHTLFIGEVVDADEIADGTAAGGAIEVLRMEDTRMNYGG